MEIPIIPILEHYGVEIHPGRNEVQILCPVHDENVRSCSVNEDKGLIHCQACGFGGDALALIMRKEDCDFGAAVRIAESIVGEISEGVSRPTGRARVGISGEARAGGYKPRYRNTPPRRRPLSAPG